MKRGEVHLAAFPNLDGSPLKVRPVLVVQADYYNQRIHNVLVAAITSNLSRKDDPAHLLIRISTPEGKRTGLNVDSLVSGLNVGVIPQKKVQRKIGELSDDLMKQLDECLKTALGI